MFYKNQVGSVSGIQPHLTYYTISHMDSEFSIAKKGEPHQIQLMAVGLKSLEHGLNKLTL